jgi:hypothetical protein
MEEHQMAYDEGLAQRIREQITDQTGVTEKKMFGGLSFLLNGNMACGVIKDELIVRVGPQSDTVHQPHARPFDFTGRPMSGWVVVEPAGFESGHSLQQWLEQGIHFAQSLPAK